ncbi:MAG TPA: hypothetical protein VMD08_11890 [Candidatus Baltobacteraceae bacterium]|nr:hypothetical protein [Candidatus Baltobacteraceae bacterium]
MDFERFDGFWRRLAKDQLGLPEALPVGALLAKALETWTGCIVCNLLRLRAFDVIARWQAALVSDLAERRDFLRCETWCNRHGWLVIELSSPRDLGRLHRQLLLAPKARMEDLLRRDLGRLRGHSPQAILACLVGERVCPLCQDEAALLRDLLDDLVQGLATGTLRATFAQSEGCCLPHLAALLAQVPDGDTARFLLEATQSVLNRLAADLDRYEEETQSHRRDYGSAADAPGRAMRVWAGRRGTASDLSASPPPAAPGEGGRPVSSARVQRGE